MYNLLLILGVFFASPGLFAKPKDPVESLRQGIFADKLTMKSCKAVSRGVKSDLKENGKEVQAIVDLLLKNLKQENVKPLTDMFHEKLKLDQTAIRQTLKKIKNISPGPYNYSVYRIWALNTVDGAPDLIPCPDDALAIGPHYGYDLQFGVWIQIMGVTELSRIYTTLVPVKGQWKLGSWHLQQWTHTGKDPEAWVNEAVEDGAAGRKIAAYIKLDLAEKLIEGHPFLFLKIKDDIATTKASHFTDATWNDAIKSLIPKENVVYLGTVLAKDGAGLLVRTKVDKESNREKLRKDCFSIGRAFVEATKEASLGGIRCSYIVEGESPTREGYLGGRFLAREALVK